MDQDDSLTRLQGLQADLVAFSESRLPNVDRLWIELEGSIADFRKLLDRQSKNNKSRQTLKSGTQTGAL
jgi:nuclear pore complex protein Nup205